MNLFFLKSLLRGKLLTTPKFEELLHQTDANQERYRRVEKMDKVKEYLDLDKKVSTPEFQSKKKEIHDVVYADTAEAKALAELKKLGKDKYVRLYLKNGSEEGRISVQRYLVLKEETQTPEFQQRNAFWANPDRWYTTEEGKMDARYEELKKDSDIDFFIHTDVHAIEHYEQFDLVFEDDFNWNGLKNSDWKPGFIYPNDKFVPVHSYTNEKQAYVGGRNIETVDSKLYIITHEENCEGPAWDSEKGMVMKNFTYSSDAIYTDKVAIKVGSVVQVKVRCHGLLNHGIYLRSKNHVPFISLFGYTGLKLFCGVKDSLYHDKNLKYLDGLQPLVSTVFTVSWQKDEIVWFVNNLEVFRTKNLIPEGEELYLHMYSFLFENVRVASEGDLEVDWVRVFQNKE